MNRQPLKDFFDPKLRMAGEILYTSEHTELEFLDWDAARVLVVSTPPQQVHLAWMYFDKLGVHCDCIAGRNGQLCSHVWAAIREVDSHFLKDFPKKAKKLYRLSPRQLAQIEDDIAIAVAQREEADQRVAEARSAGPPARQKLPLLPGEATSRSEARADQIIDAEFSLSSPQVDSSEPEELGDSELAIRLGPLFRFGVENHSRALVAARGKTELVYALIVQESQSALEVKLKLFLRKAGRVELQHVTPQGSSSGFELTLDPEDARLFRSLKECHRLTNYWRPDRGCFWLSANQFKSILPQLIATQRFGLVTHANQQPTDSGFQPVLHLNVGGWQTRITAAEDPTATAWLVDAKLHKADGSRLAQTQLVIAGETSFLGPEAILLPSSELQLLKQLSQAPLRIPKRNTAQLRVFLYRHLPVELLELPAELQLKQEPLSPQGSVRLERQHSAWRGEVGFLYDDQFVAAADASRLVFDLLEARYSPRDEIREDELLRQISELPAQELAKTSVGNDILQITCGNFPRVVNWFLERGWDVSVAKEKLKRSGDFRIEITSGLDWFDLTGHVEFDDEVVPLPEVLQRLEGSNFVRLANGGLGLLPADWQEQFGRILKLGKQTDEAVRFQPSQAFLLDAMLAEREFVSFDKTFAKVRQRIRKFDGIRPRKVRRSFQGELRPYQEQGHSWLHFLREFGLGGCLADDMGLGKTVQVLALLDTWRQDPKRKQQPEQRPCLLVVPKSLIFNWQAEAAKFAPRLRVLNYSGQGRQEAREQLPLSDVVLTTYGTLRRDIEWFREVSFDYAILDEAQAIKNADSQTAKAVRLIQAEHRLALSGTPVENRLADLWSIFEFLNPGMLGSSQVFAELGQEGDAESLERLGQALRPLLLRRTKQQVLKDLPDKTENTLYCELEGRQREIYDEVAEFYRQSLLKKVRQDGLNRSKIHVLEALLRLRQIACHPALVSSLPAKKGGKVKSAKFEVLLEQLEAVIAEGHKALVFSQFTSLLALLKPELDKRKIPFEYLDGKTQNRQRAVERFNQTASVPVFLLSLKAGGHGLNLTSADYVFILDPWWNPAVEAQAIDRAHRIGQQRHVFGYRLIAKDTIEEKILQLQQSKKQLADAIVSADSSLIRSLSVDDLELLLQ